MVSIWTLSWPTESNMAYGPKALNPDDLTLFFGREQGAERASIF